MNLKRHVLLSVVVVALVLMGCGTKSAKQYEPTRESLETHPIPQWFKDAKFGIFIHWGVYAVPAFNEWYIEFMSPRSHYGKPPEGPPYTASQGNLSDSAFKARMTGIRGEANRYHRENFGVDFEYDEFIPMFKAEKYEPEKWADLFVQAGAKYVVLTAKHGDEFALWPTKFTKRNSVEMGPHRDLAGDLLKAVRSRELKMGFYHNTTYTFWDKRYPTKEWVEYMNKSIKELVDLYQPDIIWGDVPVGPYRGSNGSPLYADHMNSKEVIAYFYNHSKNPDEVITNDRWSLDTAMSGVNSEKLLSTSLWAQYAKGWGVKDAVVLGDFQTPERTNITKIYNLPWETCDALDPSSWGYNKRTTEEEYINTNELIDYLSDIVSKGGNLLINIGPKADGTIPKVMEDRLRGIGEWLSVNGEAIYGTRPWAVYGEGPGLEEAGFSTSNRVQFKAGDVRYTTRGDILYAIMLEWPGSEITLNSLKDMKVINISLIGSDEIIQWRMINDGLNISLPKDPVSPHANTLKINFQGN